MSLYPLPKMSPLCRTIESQGRSVRVQIYEGDPGKWLLEVVDEYGNSTVWEDQFDSDQAALEEAQHTIAQEGIGVLIGEPPSSDRT